MRQKSLIQLLEYEAKRKPDIARLVNKVDSLTDNEINEAKVPFPWYRKALKELREKNVLKNNTINIENHIVEGYTPNPVGDLRKWSGDLSFVKVNNRGGEIQVDNGDLFWFPKTGGAWLDSIFIENPEPKIYSLSKFICCETFTEYKKKIRLLINNRNKNIQSNKSTVLSAYNVKIY